MWMGVEERLSENATRYATIGMRMLKKGRMSVDDLASRASVKNLARRNGCSPFSMSNNLFSPWWSVILNADTVDAKLPKDLNTRPNLYQNLLADSLTKERNIGIRLNIQREYWGWVEKKPISRIGGLAGTRESESRLDNCGIG